MDSPITKHEQTKPLAPANHRVITNDDTNNISSDRFNRRYKNYLKCCGCVAALTLILSVTFLILLFTIFHIKNPVLKLNSFTVRGRDADFTLISDVSIKNPNVAAFMFGNASIDVYYGGKVTGQHRSPPGESKAKGTMRMNMTVEIMFEKFLDDSNLLNDLIREELRINTHTRVEGRVKITRFLKKHVVATMNCTININVKSMEIERHDCYV